MFQERERGVVPPYLTPYLPPPPFETHSFISPNRLHNRSLAIIASPPDIPAAFRNQLRIK